MAYARTAPTNEVSQLQQEITREVNTDAEHLARSVFGKPGAQPDMARVDDQTIDARFRQAYQTQDRKWLVGEAQRDPEQFVKIARRIGVMLPEESAPTTQPEALPAALPAPPPSPMMAAPLPPAPPVVSPAPLALPGAVASPGQPVPLTVPAPGV
jgi:hypothetical protein